MRERQDALIDGMEMRGVADNKSLHIVLRRQRLCTGVSNTDFFNKPTQVAQLEGFRGRLRASAPTALNPCQFFACAVTCFALCLWLREAKSCLASLCDSPRSVEFDGYGSEGTCRHLLKFAASSCFLEDSV